MRINCNKMKMDTISKQVENQLKKRRRYKNDTFNGTLFISSEIRRRGSL